MSFTIDPQKPLNILFFDLCSDGHHPSYIRHLIKYWNKADCSGSISFVVHIDLVKKHRDIVDLAEKNKDRGVSIVCIEASEASALKPIQPQISRAFRYFQEWSLFCKYARRLNANHGFLLYLDTYMIPMLLGAKPPCPVSGIYFRPSFHYPALRGYQLEHSSYRKKIAAQREKFILYRLLNLNYFDTAFSLDPFVCDYIDHSKITSKIVDLPDPVDPITVEDRKSNYEDYPLDKEKRITFLFFGRIDRRKGIFEMLDAIYNIPKEICQKIRILVIGQASKRDALLINLKVSDITKKQPIDINCYFEFVSDSEMNNYFKTSDVVLALYQNHVGMSGILLQAAAAQKPVLSSDYGLMGELVKRYRLGIVVDSTNPLSISKGFIRFLQEDISKICDVEGMQKISKKNSAEKFPKRIFEVLEGSNS
jgi:glycosyltransferase involved in cell wall biosynthesis